MIRKIALSFTAFITLALFAFCGAYMINHGSKILGWWLVGSGAAIFIGTMMYALGGHDASNQEV